MARDEWDWIERVPKVRLFKEPKKRIRWITEDGTGADAWKDFEKLTGGKYNPTPEPGTGQIVGENGIRYRPGNETAARELKFLRTGKNHQRGFTTDGRTTS